MEASWLYDDFQYPALLSMTALTIMAFSRQVYPDFPVARKPTPLLASPIIFPQYYEKNGLMTILQFILLVSDNFTVKLPEKASFCVIMRD